MRFLLDEVGNVSSPADFFCREIQGEPLVPHPPPAGSVAVIYGATRESIAAAAGTRDLADLAGQDGRAVFCRHTHCLGFRYELTGEPVLSLAVEREEPTGLMNLKFRNAVITDWITEPDYSSSHPNDELCELRWDGDRHFMLAFLSVMVILRADSLTFIPD